MPRFRTHICVELEAPDEKSAAWLTANLAKQVKKLDFAIVESFAASDVTPSPRLAREKSA